MTLHAAPTRTRRFLGGLSLGYLQTALVVLVNLWLTPYLLRHLGQHDYGLWLLAAQVLLYLGLMDLGVVALLPREVAYTAGAAGSGRPADLPALVGRVTRLVLWQTPAALMAGLAAWWLIPLEWAPLRWPLLLVVLAFAATFPVRIFHGVLQGLQDLPYLGATQLAGWTAGTLITIVGVMAGFGLYSLAVGWIASQVLSAALAWRRLRARFPGAVPARLPPLTRAAVREQFGRGVWVSVSQVAQALLNGTDLLVIGTLLGPEAVVPYACTGKLVMLLGNQPQLFMQMALPALSELRATAPRARLFDVSTSMTQVMLIGSGAVAAVVLAVNEPFVTWWVGASRYGGTRLTLLFTLGMLLRHLSTTAGYTLFCFGYERRLALTAIAEGLVGLGAMLVLVPIVGVPGAAIGLVTATAVVSLPGNLGALAREQGTSLRALLAPLRPWFLRFCGVCAGVAALVTVWTVSGLWLSVGAAAVVGAAYAAVMLPVLFAPPLGPMVRHQLQPLAPFMAGLARRLIREQPAP
ncbi:MAG: oligosaccharide flippase family protein [Gemmatimonadetes bacterium]|nr:oligosaccharide flippase family protein [Gemmatimonadota bacterium]